MVRRTLSGRAVKTLRAVLDQRSLRFEDARGMGTAIELGSIDS